MLMRLSTQGIRWGCAHAKMTRLLLMSISRIDISIWSHSACMSSSSCTCDHRGVRCNACRCQCHCQLASTPMISNYQICRKNHSNEFFRKLYAVSPERILCRIQLKNPFQVLRDQFLFIGEPIYLPHTYGRELLSVGVVCKRDRKINTITERLYHLYHCIGM